jgi:hypothetical protein
LEADETVASKRHVVPLSVLISMVIGATRAGDNLPEMLILRPLIVEEKSVLQVIELTPIDN